MLCVLFKASEYLVTRARLLVGQPLLTITIVTYFWNWNFSVILYGVRRSSVPGWTDYLHPLKPGVPDAIITTVSPRLLHQWINKKIKDFLY